MLRKLEKGSLSAESSLLLDLRRPGKKTWHRGETSTQLDESKSKEERYH